MKTINLSLIISALFLIAVITIVQLPEPEEKPEKEINYIIKAKTANRLYIKDALPGAKVPLLSNEIGKILQFEVIKKLYSPANENCVYISLNGGTFSIGEEIYFYESIIEIERDNQNATYGLSGIKIIYFKSFGD